MKTFTDVVEGKNSFTPRVLAYYKIEDGAIELSTVKSNQPRGITESGFMEDVYGVTVVVNGQRNSEKDKLCDSYQRAVDYINEFKPTQKQYYQRVNSYGDTQLMTEKL